MHCEMYFGLVSAADAELAASAAAISSTPGGNETVMPAVKLPVLRADFGSAACTARDTAKAAGEIAVAEVKSGIMSNMTTMEPL